MIQMIGLATQISQTAQKAKTRKLKNILETEKPEPPQEQHELNWTKSFKYKKVDLTKILIQKIWITKNIAFLKTAVNTNDQ